MQEKIEILRGKLDAQINSFEAKRIYNRKRAIFLGVSVMILNGLTTIILGAEISPQNYEIIQLVKNGALILSALATFINSLLLFFDYKNLWIIYTQTKTRLKGLEFDLEYYLSSNDDIDSRKLEQYKDEFQDILADTNIHWRKTKIN